MVTMGTTREVEAPAGLLARERSREAGQRKLLRLYAGRGIDPFDLMAAIRTGLESVEVVNDRLLRSGVPASRLPEPVVEEPEPEQPERFRQRGLFDPFGVTEVPVPEAPSEVPAREKRPVAPRSAPVTSIRTPKGAVGHPDDDQPVQRATDKAAGQWSRANGLPHHRADRYSQGRAGRHLRAVRARARRLDVTEQVADRDMVHRHPEDCPYRNAAVRKAPA